MLSFWVFALHLLCRCGICSTVRNWQRGTGRAKDIPLGLDLQGGVSVTYRDCEEKDATDEEIEMQL